MPCRTEHPTIENRATSLRLQLQLRSLAQQWRIHSLEKENARLEAYNTIKYKVETWKQQLSAAEHITAEMVPYYQEEHAFESHLHSQETTPFTESPSLTLLTSHLHTIQRERANLELVFALATGPGTSGLKEALQLKRLEEVIALTRLVRIDEELVSYRQWREAVGGTDAVGISGEIGVLMERARVREFGKEGGFGEGEVEGMEGDGDLERADGDWEWADENGEEVVE